MRTSSSKFASVALALAALIAIAEVGPRALGDNELSLSDHGPAPEFAGTSSWLNSSPLTVASLQGKVVLIQFWTFSCINSFRALPYAKKWYETYKDKGFTVIGVSHARVRLREGDEQCRNRDQKPGSHLSGPAG